MYGYEYDYFKIALAEWKEEAHQELLRDIEHVKQVVESGLEKVFNSTTFSARTQYPGLEI